MRNLETLAIFTRFWLPCVMKVIVKTVGMTAKPAWLTLADQDSVC